MITNEAFDDDIPDETEIDAMMEAGTPVEIVTERPAGQFSRMLAGREIWFKAPIPGQFSAFKRYRETLARRYEVISVRAEKTRNIELIQELRDLHDKIEMSTLEFFEALLVDEDDIDFVALEMISGRVTMDDIHVVMFGEQEPEDDQEPVKKSKPVRKQPATKKAANAKRTQRK